MSCIIQRNCRKKPLLSKSPLHLFQKSYNLIPMKIGIMSFQCVPNHRFCRGEGFVEFCKSFYCLELSDLMVKFHIGTG